MSVMLASDAIVLDTVVQRVALEGDHVHRTGTEDGLEVFQGIVPGNPFLAIVGGREVTTVEYGLEVSVLMTCSCVFRWAGGISEHYQDACGLPAHAHF